MPPSRSSSHDDLVRGPGRPRTGDGTNHEVAERLLDAATQLAVEQGFEASGLREIAARAEVSSGMIAYYFGDRQGLYEAMFQRAIDRVSAEVVALLEDPERQDEDRLDDLVQIHVKSIAADPLLPRLIIREVLAKTDSSLKGVLVDRVGQGAMRLMIRWIEEEQARGILRSDIDASFLAMTLVSLSVFPFLMVPVIGEEIGIEIDEDFPDRLIEHNQKILARGILANSEDRS